MSRRRRFLYFTLSVVLAAMAVSSPSAVMSSSSSSTHHPSPSSSLFAFAAVSSDLNIDAEEPEIDYDAEFNSGIEAMDARDDGSAALYGNVNPDGSYNDEGDDNNAEEEGYDHVDYTNNDDGSNYGDDDDDSMDKKQTQKNGGRRGGKGKDDGVLPDLADQADKLLDQSRGLAKNSEIFKKEVSEISSLPRKLTNTAARLVKLAKQPSYSSQAFVFRSQATQLKEQAGSINNIVQQLLENIPEYENESVKLARQAEALKDLAEEHIIQEVSSDDKSVVELRREVKKLARSYGRTLSKSDELRKTLQQMKEHADSVNKMAAALPYRQQ